MNQQEAIIVAAAAAAVCKRCNSDNTNWVHGGSEYSTGHYIIKHWMCYKCLNTFHTKVSKQKLDRDTKIKAILDEMKQRLREINRAQEEEELNELTEYANELLKMGIERSDLAVVMIDRLVKRKRIFSKRQVYNALEKMT